MLYVSKNYMQGVGAHNCSNLQRCAPCTPLIVLLCVLFLNKILGAIYFNKKKFT